MGETWGGDRNLYDALGYPLEETLDFDWFYNRYERQEIATAIIDRPADAVWDGDINIIEEETEEKDSTLKNEWIGLNEKLKLEHHLSRLDKLANIGEFAILLFGFSDVKESKDFEIPAGSNLQLHYVKPVAQRDVWVDQWEDDASNPRFGWPKFYRISIGVPGKEESRELFVHHSRVLHVTKGSLTSEIFGTPTLKPIANRLIDIDKILGGDAEMFWRGARPGYTATPKDDYEMTPDEEEQLEEELSKYEHDLRRFINAQGVDINALQQQVADPLNHLDAQLQAVSSYTEIPKRVLVGSEQGELSSGQDRSQFLTLVKKRRENWNEPFVLRPVIDKLMMHGVLTRSSYNVQWEDLFSPSEKEKVEIGKLRADALKVYAERPAATEIIPPKLANRFLLGLTEEQAEEVEEAMQAEVNQEDMFEEVEGGEE